METSPIDRKYVRQTKKSRKPRVHIEVTFRVKMVLPEGATVNAATNYVRTAVQGWKGGLDFQNDPMAKLDADKTTVSLLRKREDIQYGSEE